MQNHHPMPLFYLMEKIWISGVQKARISTKAAGWKVHDNIMTVDKKAKGIITRQRFMDYQLHAEFRIPENITGTGQARGNSGIFLACISDSGCRCRI